MERSPNCPKRPLILPRSGGDLLANFLKAAIVLVLPLTSCARVEFRRAMESIQESRVRLHDRVEAGRFEESRSAASALAEALRHPAISGLYRNDAEFNALRIDAVDAAEAFGRDIEEQDREEQLELLAILSSRCAACHDQFRK